MVRIEPSHPAPVLLVELVAFGVVHQIVREIGEQIHVVIEDIGRKSSTRNSRFGDATHLASYSAGCAHRQTVQCAEEANDRLGGNGDLIARVPFSVVDVSSDAGAIGVVALTVGQNAVDFVKAIRMYPWAVIVGLFSAVEQMPAPSFCDTPKTARP